MRRRNAPPKRGKTVGEQLIERVAFVHTADLNGFWVHFLILLQFTNQIFKFLL